MAKKPNKAQKRKREIWRARHEGLTRKEWRKKKKGKQRSPKIKPKLVL